MIIQFIEDIAKLALISAAVCALVLLFVGVA